MEIAWFHRHVGFRPTEADCDIWMGAIEADGPVLFCLTRDGVGVAGMVNPRLLCSRRIDTRWRLPVARYPLVCSDCMIATTRFV